MIRAIVLLAVLCLPLASQNRRGTYIVEYKKALSSSTQVITVQLPSSSSNRTARFDALSMEMSAACEFTLERDGTAATATSLTVNRLNGRDANPGAAVAFRDSNVGAGTTIGRYTVPAGGILSLDMTNKGLIPGENLTVRSASCTGTSIVLIQWSEY